MSKSHYAELWPHRDRGFRDRLEVARRLDRSSAAGGGAKEFGEGQRVEVPPGDDGDSPATGDHLEGRDRCGARAFDHRLLAERRWTTVCCAPALR